MPQSLKPIDSTIDVVTPENISFQYQLAGPFRRFPAFLIDLCIRVAIWIGALLLFSLSGLFGGGGQALGIALWLLLWFLLEWFYGGLLETYWNGQTVGKRLLGMRVLRVDGQPINGLQAVMRNVLRSVDLMPLIPVGMWFGEEGPWAIPTCLIGLLTPIFNKRYQRLGDLVCGTMVVVEERQWLATLAKVEDAPIATLAEALPASLTVSPKLSQALAAYVERRKYLSVPRRAEIAKHLGDPLVKKIGFPEDTNHDQLLCALYYRTFVARRYQVNESVTGVAATEAPDDTAPTPPPIADLTSAPTDPVKA